MTLISSRRLRVFHDDHARARTDSISDAAPATDRLAARRARDSSLALEVYFACSWHAKVLVWSSRRMLDAIKGLPRSSTTRPQRHCRLDRQPVFAKIRYRTVSRKSGALSASRDCAFARSLIRWLADALPAASARLTAPDEAGSLGLPTNGQARRLLKYGALLVQLRPKSDPSARRAIFCSGLFPDRYLRLCRVRYPRHPLRPCGLRFHGNLPGRIGICNSYGSLARACSTRLRGTRMSTAKLLSWPRRSSRTTRERSSASF